MTTDVKVKTEAELMTELQSALKSGDFKVVAKVSTEIAKVQKAKEATELEAKQKLLADLSLKVKGIIDKAISRMIEAGELDAADGIWYVKDFGEKLVTCRLMKSQIKTRTTGGGTGKRFNFNSVEAVTVGKYASEPYKDTGKTFKEAWESNTDKNWRYAIRQEVLKKEGLIS